MTLRWIPAFFAATVAASSLVVVVASIATGCSGDDTSTPTPLPTQCPATLAAANGQACATGLSCPYEFACGSFQQQATCACTGGKLACAVDATDASIATGSTPTCSPTSNPATCPAHEPDNLSTCTAIGLTCLYDDLVCSGSTAPNIDTCECQGGTNGGLVYNCVIAECAGGGDSGVVSPADAHADQHAPDAADSATAVVDATDDGG